MAIQKVIYHASEDGRKNLYDLNGPNSDRIRQQAQSVACFVRRGMLVRESSSNGYRIRTDALSLDSVLREDKGYPLGYNERFRDEIVLGYGTGALVTPKTIVTAAHVLCVKDSDSISENRLADTYVVFGYYMQSATQPKRRFTENEVYRIEGVIAHHFSKTSAEWADWMVIKLNRPVVGITPLTLNMTLLQNDLELYMLGYPDGIHGKCTENALVKKVNHVDYFECKMDAFCGNSGSPVFRADTGEIVGILCDGWNDYEVVSNYKGSGFKRVVPVRIDPDTATEFEKCQRVSQLSFVKEHIDLWQSGFKLRTSACSLDGLSPGFYVYGKCTNASCSVVNQSMWMHRGMGTFHLDEVVCRSTCVTCYQVIEVLDLGFYKSGYQIEGELKEPKVISVRKESVVAKAKMKTLDQGVSFKWKSFKIQVFKA